MFDLLVRPALPFAFLSLALTSFRLTVEVRYQAARLAADTRSAADYRVGLYDYSPPIVWARHVG